MYEHAATVRRFLHSRVDRAHLDDATQETFLRALSRRDTLKEEEKLVPWLLGIARLVSCEHARARRRILERIDARDVELEDEAANPEAAVLGREAEAAVAVALGTLDEPRRRALLMRVSGDVSYDQIARAMGWSVAKVKNEIHRGRRQLRALLAVSLSLLVLVLLVGRPVRPSAPSLPDARIVAEAWCVGPGPEQLACIEPDPAPATHEGPLCR